MRAVGVYARWDCAGTHTLICWKRISRTVKFKQNTETHMNQNRSWHVAPHDDMTPLYIPLTRTPLSALSPHTILTRRAYSYSTTLISNETPAMTHFDGGFLVFSPAVKT